MILTPAQDVVAADLTRFRVMCCGRRFGKTTLAVEEIKGKAVSRPSRIVYIAPTYQQARDIAWAELKRELMPVVVNVNESRLEIRVRTMRGGESIIMLRGWESIETLRGQKFDFIIIDEVASMRAFWEKWQEVIRPTLTDMKGEGLFISTPKGYNHFYELFSKDPNQQPVKGIDQDPDFKSFHFSSYDNPHLPVEEIDKAEKELTEDRFAQEYMADFRKMEGLVYKEFDRAIHVYTDAVFNPIERLAGIDWGWTNPASSHLFQKDTDRHYWITEEFYKTGKTTSEIIEWVKSTRPDKVYPDPAEPDRNEEARRAKLNVRDVSKDIEAGVNCVREIIKQGRLHIHSSCVNLIAEFESYRYPDKKPEKNEPEIPVKEFDHAMDEIRYVLYMQEAGNGKREFAVTHYSSATMPRNNLNPVSDTHGAPPIPTQNQPKGPAHTYIPRL